MAAVDFGNVKSDAGLAKLNAHMLEHTFVQGGQPSPADATTFSKMIGAPNATKYPFAARWYKTIASYTAEERSNWTVATAAAPAAPAAAAPAAAAAKPAAPAAAADDSDDDLFGSDDEADAKAAEEFKKKAAEAKQKAEAAKKPKKEIVAKSTVTLEIRATSSDINLDDLAKQIQAIEIEGLQWVKSWEVKSLFYGLSALIMGCIIIDELVPLEDINRAIMCVGLSAELAKARNEAIDQGIDFDEEDECLVKSVSTMPNQNYSTFDYHNAFSSPNTKANLHDKLNSIFILPRVIVFDVDDTLLDGDCSWLSGPPFLPNEQQDDGSITTCRAKHSGVIGPFPEALSVLHWLRYQQQFDLRLPEHQTAIRRGEPAPPTTTHYQQTNAALQSIPPHAQIAYASRSDDPKWMRQILACLRLPNCSDDTPGLNLMKLANYAEIYPGDKATHLRKIAADARCSLSEMLLYDNEGRNIRTAEKLGVPALYVPRGLNWTNFIEGLYNYQQTVLKSQGPSGELAQLIATTTAEDTIVV